MRGTRAAIELATALVVGFGLAAPVSLAQTAQPAAPFVAPRLLPLAGTLAERQSYAPGALKPIRNRFATGPVNLGTVKPALIPFAGRLAIVTPDGANHFCSGQFVHPKVVLTAAHCVRENGTGVSYTIGEFKREGLPTSYTVDGLNCVKLPVNWNTVTHEYLRIQYDYAFVKVKPDVTGAFPVSLMNGNPIGSAVIAIGYPFSAGAGLQGIAATIILDPLHQTSSSFVTSSLGFTEGTSGGAWVDQGGGPNGPFRIASVNSSYAVGLYDQTTMRVYGPDLTAADAQQLLSEAANCVAE